MEELRTKLLGQAYLFDDPAAYRAGVEDALASVVETVDLVEVARGDGRHLVALA